MTSLSQLDVQTFSYWLRCAEEAHKEIIAMQPTEDEKRAMQVAAHFGISSDDHPHVVLNKLMHVVGMTHASLKEDVARIARLFDMPLVIEYVEMLAFQLPDMERPKYIAGTNLQLDRVDTFIGENRDHIRLAADVTKETMQ